MRMPDDEPRYSMDPFPLAGLCDCSAGSLSVNGEPYILCSLRRSFLRSPTDKQNITAFSFPEPWAKTAASYRQSLPASLSAQHHDVVQHRVASHPDC